MISFQLIRHATILLRFDKVSILVDPMLGDKEAMGPIPNGGNAFRIPMNDLPLAPDSLFSLIDEVDAILITHLHRYHWDERAQQLIPKHKPLFCQPPDVVKLRSQGFTNVRVIVFDIWWKEINISRTPGQHGKGEMGKKMAPVSGYGLQYDRSCVYIAGDTILCPEVRASLRSFHPDHTIVNAGGAEFITGGPITMTRNDVQQLSNFAPFTRIIAVHMDSINHCRYGKAELAEFIHTHDLAERVAIPTEGETIILK